MPMELRLVRLLVLLGVAAFSPPPATHSGMPPDCTGSGRTIAPSTW